MRTFLAGVALLATPFSLAAQTTPVAQAVAGSPLEQRAADVVALLNGKALPNDVMTEQFLAAVPPAQLGQIIAQLTSQFGAAVEVTSLAPSAPDRAAITIRFEHALAHGGIAIEPAAPHRISELVFQTFEPIGDDVGKISADLDQLPGSTAAWFGPLDGAPVLAHGDAVRQFAIGSTFKLYVLAALARAVDEGRLRWDQVVPLSDRSFPSGQMQDWPAGAPVTLHTLATMMISISDNTAADQLIDVVGRDAVAREVAATGHADPARMLPFLKTRELFTLKATGAANAYGAAGEAEQAHWLAGLDTASTQTDAVAAMFAAGMPVAIDSVEWFASMADEHGLLREISTLPDQTARDIMAVNPALPAALRSNWQYVGYKGGSEPGVLNLTWLLQDKAGKWYMLALSWNNPQAEVDTSALMAIAQRILALKP